MVKIISLVIFTFIVINYCVKVESFFCEPIFYPKIFGWILDALGVEDALLYLYAKNYYSRILIPKDARQLKYLKFDPNLKTTIIIHGFVSDGNDPWVIDIVKKLRGKENVIVVDWSNVFLKNNYNYAASVHTMSDVAYTVYKVLHKLAIAFGMKLKDWKYIHIIGHSLGAHLAGLVAKRVSSEAIIDRITALDPAKPYFEKRKNPRLRLNKTYARFIDVIHTNSNPHDPATFGMFEQLGHIDFYPNTGDRQPRCNKKKKIIIWGAISCIFYKISGIDASPLFDNYVYRKILGDDMICDHAEAHNFFVESIGFQDKFIARKINISTAHSSENRCKRINCTEDVCVEMGLNAQSYAEPRYYGAYYLDIPNC